MITVTNRALLESAPALRELADMPIPVRTALKVRKILRVSQEHINDAREQLSALSKRMAVMDEAGKQLPATEEHVKAAEEVLATEVELDFKLIKAEDLADPKDPPLKVKSALLFSLDWLFADEEG